MPKKVSSLKNKTIKSWRHVLPDEQKWWQLVDSQLNSLAQDYGYQKIDLPVFSLARIHEKNIRSSSNYANQNLVNVQNSKRERIILRDNLLVPLAQAYIKYNMHNLNQPLKFYSKGPIFRADQSSEGGCKQLHMFSFSLMGENQPSHDAQTIYIAYNFAKDLFGDVEIEINNFGCRACQTNYTRRLVSFIKHQPTSHYCRKCQTLVDSDPLQVLNCENEKCQSSLLEAPQVIDFLCDDCKERFVKVLEDLDDLDLSYTLNSRFVPQDPYWDQTIFSIYRINRAGNKQVLMSGSRQDEIVASLGNHSPGMISFFGYFENLVNNLKEYNKLTPEIQQVDVFVARLGNDAKKKCFKLFSDLRSSQIKVRESFTKEGLKSQLETAIKIGARYTLIIGQKEIIDNTVIVRDMESGIQEIINFEKTISEVKKRLSAQSNSSVTVYKMN